MSRAGRLLVLEGVDGCGKTTQQRRLVDHLTAAGHQVLALRDPGGTDLGEAVRSLILDPATEASPIAELHAYCLARAQLATERIRPALAAGHWVVLDRWYFSTIAYQAAGLGLPVDAVARVVRFGLEDLVPDLALWYQVPVAEAAARRAAERGEDRIEARGLAYLERVAAGYQRQADAGELVVVAANAGVDAVHAATLEQLQGWQSAR